MSDLFGAVAAAVDRHPILELDAASCTPQLGRPGLWSDRLPHFRMGFTPSSGEEIQSEYLLPRRYAVEAIEAVRTLADRVRPLLQVSEIRAVAADRLWMSMNYGEDTVGIHFTWKPERDAVEDMLVQLEGALGPVRSTTALGQALQRGRGSDLSALRAHARLHPSCRAARPARSFLQLVVENSRAW